ncbi:MAG: bifunctional glycosyltransferase family 2/GtrA family protein [Acidimicrobiia bacterium]|nr:bifunctional glycosyltransferase family 2/GtrA family protein [Acidimicrobiia bacterium]
MQTLADTATLPPDARDPGPAPGASGPLPAPRPRGELREAAAVGERDTRPLVEIVVPVHDEERDLERCVRRLTTHLEERFPFRYRVTIADNGSTDGTWRIACRLAATVRHVRAVHLDEKGRGLALRHVWGTSRADVVAYTDVDLSTDLDALLPLVAPLVSGHSDLAIGSRLLPGARVARGPKRELISRAYNRLLRTVARARFRDAQCGFKAGRREVVQALLPAVENDRWFFDTELLLLAQHNGLRIHEVPVDWVDDPDSRVRIVSTALEDLRGLGRVLGRVAAGRFRVDVPSPRARSARLHHQLLRFAGVGLLCTAGYLALYALLRGWWGPQAANAGSLVVMTVVNTSLNRWFTFGVSGTRRLLRDHAEAAAVFVLALALSAAALVATDAVWPDPPRLAELAALLGANVVATLTRFALLRSWVFDPGRRA